LKNSKGIFRGINNASYQIFTSLQRNKLQGAIASSFSIDSYIQNFRKMEAVKRYFNAYGFNPSKIAMLSFLQHHGAPTSLLDFTSSIRVALFFAMEKMIGNNFTPSENDIENYFSIFHITEEDLKLINVDQVFKDIDNYKKEYIDTWGKQEENASLYLNHIDQFADMNTMEVFLIDFKNQYPAFNVQNSIRILNQEGLFINNSYGEKPLEIALKEFFIPATRFVGSELDEIDDPQVIKQNEQYRRDLEKNQQIQIKLGKNIITSYEIHISLIPKIAELDLIDRSVIYPDFETLCKQAFEETNQIRS
jgi:hypothetical protein